MKLFIILLMTTTWKGTASALPLSPEGIYYRCHAHFSGVQPDRNDTRLTAVKSANTVSTAIDQCIDLLNSANLGADGIIVTKSGADVETTARKVLQTFTDFHHSWFPRWNFGEDDGCSTHEIYDVGEMSLHLSRSMFSSNHFSETLTASGTFESIRISESGTSRGYFVNCPTWLDRTTFEFKYGAGNTTWTPKITSIGKLIGIKPLDHASEPNLPEIMLRDSTEANSRKIHQPFGAGIIGTVPYLLLNMGHGADAPPFNGGMGRPRRWSKSVFKDILCRDLPLLRSADADPYVQTSATTNIPFRTGQSCMTCHRSMDPLTGAIRHLQAGVSVPPFLSGSTMHIFSHSNSESAGESNPVENDASFHLRPRTGRLVMRTYDGTLIDQEFSGLAGLGSSLAALDDPYICAAKKYYHFLTGIEVPIYDYNDPLAPTAATSEISHRNTIISLGRNLKSHGDLKQMVKEIISLPIYRDRGFGGQ